MKSERGYALFEWINTHTWPLTTGVVAVAVGLMIVGGVVADRGEPEFAPGGEIHDIEERADDVFSTSSPIRAAAYLVERPDGGDVLTRDSLLEFEANVATVLADPESQLHLVRSFDSDLGLEVDGILSIAGSVDEMVGGLENASNADVKVALDELLADDAPTSTLRFNLSQLTSRELVSIDGGQITLWESPAFITNVRYDVDSFEGETEESFGDEINFDAERWLRDVQVMLRGDQQNATAIGIGIDQGLVGEEVNQTSGPFIFLAVATILVLVGALLRSYWAAMVAAAGLGVVMMGYNGINAVAGLKTGSPLLILIVPIALISFGIDFYIHGCGRARELQVEGYNRERAYPLGATALFTALLLAASSSAGAFLSNSASGVQAIIEFGIASAVAIALSYFVLGLLAPRVLLAIEEALGPRPDLHRSFAVGVRLVGKKVGFTIAAILGGVAVALAIVLPAAGSAGAFVGAGIYLFFLALVVYVPFLRARRRNRRAAERGVPVTDVIKGAGHGFRAAGSVVHFLARWRVITIPIVAVIAVLGVLGAFRVESAFELRDFFSERTDFIKSLDKLEVHFGASTGQTGYIYMEGDLTDPATLAAIDDAVAELDASGAELGRDFNGDLDITPNAVTVARIATSSRPMQQGVMDETGIEVTDGDDDGLPDSRDQVGAVYDFAAANGVTNDDGFTVFRPDQLETFLYVEGEKQATRVEVIIPTITDDAIILAARSALEDAADNLRPRVGAVDVVSVSGSGITQQDALESFTQSMLTSLPIAVILTAILATVVLRSFRFGLISMVPILLVVAWIYGFMFLFDYNINVITATIAAIAIGVGIDFSTHFTVRFREEFDGEPSRFPALRRAGEGTGGALALSALTSMAGFLVMATAPTPLFATFGMLTAVMIVLALLVSLLILPSLLLFVTPSRKGEEREQLEWEITLGRWEYEPHERPTATRDPERPTPGA